MSHLCLTSPVSWTFCKGNPNTEEITQARRGNPKYINRVLHRYGFTCSFRAAGDVGMGMVSWVFAGICTYCATPLNHDDNSPITNHPSLLWCDCVVYQGYFSITFAVVPQGIPPKWWVFSASGSRVVTCLVSGCSIINIIVYQVFLTFWQQQVHSKSYRQKSILKKQQHIVKLLAMIFTLPAIHQVFSSMCCDLFHFNVLMPF